MTQLSTKEEIMMKKIDSLEQAVKTVFDSHSDYPYEEFTLKSIIEGVNKVLNDYMSPDLLKNK